MTLEKTAAFEKLINTASSSSLLPWSTTSSHHPSDKEPALLANHAYLDSSVPLSKKEKNEYIVEMSDELKGPLNACN